MDGKPSPQLAALSNLAGQRVDSFDLVRVIGTGGMGVVYLARDRVLHRGVALKLIGRLVGANDAARYDFLLREARAAAKLIHPNVVQIYQVGRTDEFQYIAMEYVPGMNAARLARRHGNRLPQEFCMRRMREAASALELASSMGICHQDIKPSNLLLNGSGTLKIADFGLASYVEGKEAVALPTSNRIQGTPAYMSPEQWRGEEITSATDVYSLGCTMYRLVVGTPPYGKRDFMDNYHAHLQEPVPDPRAAMPGVDPSFADLLQVCMTKRAADRPTAKDITVAIDAILLDRSPPVAEAVPASGPEHDAEPTTPSARGHEGVTADYVFPFRRGTTQRDGDATGTASLVVSHTSVTPLDHGGERTYQNVFGLEGYPFSDIRQPDWFWNSGPYGWALRTLGMQLSGGSEGSMLLGPPGSGRTFLCDMLPQVYPDLYLFRVEPQLLFGEPILLSLCRQHGLEPNPTASVRFLAQVFVSHILPDQTDAVAVLVIDTVDPDDVEVLRDLADLMSGQASRRLSLVLVGDTDLAEKLAETGAPSVLYTGAPPVLLRPMTQQEVAEYVDYRMTTIAGSNRGLELDKAMRQLLHLRSGGVPKLVNVYCHNALTIAALRDEPRVSFDSLRLGMKRKVYLSPQAAAKLMEESA